MSIRKNVQAIMGYHFEQKMYMYFLMSILYLFMGYHFEQKMYFWGQFYASNFSGFVQCVNNMLLNRSFRVGKLEVNQP